jgi:hypothetical protein
MSPRLSRALAGMLIVVAFSAAVLGQSTRTIRVPLEPSEEIAVVTFYPSRESAEDVRRWMKLADHSYYSAPVVGSFDCAQNPSVQNLRRAVEMNRQLVEELNPRGYPPELGAVVSYLRSLQSFWLWLQERELAFLKNGSLPALEWNGIDATSRCSQTVDSIRRSASSNQACTVLMHDWNNCLNSVVQGGAWLLSLGELEVVSAEIRYGGKALLNRQLEILVFAARCSDIAGCGIRSRLNQRQTGSQHLRGQASKQKAQREPKSMRFRNS